MKNDPTPMHMKPIMYIQHKSPETLSILPPQGWIKLPNGQSFEIAQVAWLGETIEEYDKATSCNVFHFLIQLSHDHSFCECKIYDYIQTSNSRRKILSELDKFRCQIAAARWGDRCIEMEKFVLK
jgi:hypothetical protein